MEAYQNLHWALLSHKCLEGLKPKQQLITWILWNYMITFGHFGKDNYIVVPQTKIKKALRVHQSYVREAIKHLEEQGMIECVLQPRYSKGISGAWKLSTGCRQIARNLYTKGHKPVDKWTKPVDSPDYHTNYTKDNYIPTKEESTNSSSIEESVSPSETKHPEAPQDKWEWLQAFNEKAEKNGTL